MGYYVEWMEAMCYPLKSILMGHLEAVIYLGKNRTGNISTGTVLQSNKNFHQSSSSVSWVSQVHFYMQGMITEFEYKCKWVYKKKGRWG